jgi:thiamine-monophosphate kinase
MSGPKSGGTRKRSALSAEDRLIAQHFKPLARHPGAFGLVDDAAVLMPPKGHEVVLKTDAIVGGVHFFAEDSPETVGRKALRVNLSDLAAKGAQPAGFLLSLVITGSAPTRKRTAARCSAAIPTGPRVRS